MALRQILETTDGATVDADRVWMPSGLGDDENWQSRRRLVERGRRRRQRTAAGEIIRESHLGRSSPNVRGQRWTRWVLGFFLKEQTI